MVTKNIPVKDRHKELILIAYHHIAERGFEGLRVHDVATEAGINNATLHYYFPTKEDLIQGVTDFMIEKLSKSYTIEAVAKESHDAWIEMRTELEDTRQSFRNDRDLLVVFTELLARSIRDPAIAEIFKKHNENWRDYLAGIIERGVRQGAFRSDLDPAVVAMLIMLQIKGFGLHLLGESDRATTDEIFDQLVLQVKTWLSGEFKN
jgi:AcrR family transcriptional regulator